MTERNYRIGRSCAHVRGTGLIGATYYARSGHRISEEGDGSGLARSPTFS